MTQPYNAATVPIRNGRPPSLPREVSTVKLLNVGRDKQLLAVRGSYLSLLGFEVVDALDPADALRHLQSDSAFEFVLLCHSLDRSEKLKVESCLQNGSTPAVVLELYLTDLSVTSWIRVEGSTEFTLFMRTLAGQELQDHSAQEFCHKDSLPLPLPLQLSH